MAILASLEIPPAEAVTGMLFRADRVFTGREHHSPGLIEISAGRVVRVGPVGAGDREAATIDLGAVTAAPGYVDVHCHGGAGSAAGDDPQTVAGFHRKHGTTTLVASLVTQRLSVLREQVRRLAGFVAAGEVAGIHLEGPWLSEKHKGAHPALWLRDPDLTEIAALLAAAPGAIRMVTIAPERTGGLDAIRMLTERGIVAALGHTGASFTQARDAIAAGATGATHLFNAMPPLAHRDPGAVLALLADERVFLELVVDGTHLDLALVAWVAGQYPERVVLVTDAMAAAGQPDGNYRLGELAVEVVGGIARIAGTSTIAGSTLTLARAVRTAIAAGVRWETALRAATLTPARYLNLPDVGELRPGARADLVVLDREWKVQRVMRRGEWLV